MRHTAAPFWTQLAMPTLLPSSRQVKLIEMPDADRLDPTFAVGSDAADPGAAITIMASRDLLGSSYEQEGAGETDAEGGEIAMLSLGRAASAQQQQQQQQLQQLLQQQVQAQAEAQAQRRRAAAEARRARAHRDLLRMAMELAVMRSVQHVNVVQVGRGLAVWECGSGERGRWRWREACSTLALCSGCVELAG